MNDGEFGRFRVRGEKAGSPEGQCVVRASDVVIVKTGLRGLGAVIVTTNQSRVSVTSSVDEVCRVLGLAIGATGEDEEGVQC